MKPKCAFHLVDTTLSVTTFRFVYDTSYKFRLFTEAMIRLKRYKIRKFVKSRNMWLISWSKRNLFTNNSRVYWVKSSFGFILQNTTEYHTESYLILFVLNLGTFYFSTLTIRKEYIFLKINSNITLPSAPWSCLQVFPIRTLNEFIFSPTCSMPRPFRRTSLLQKHFF